MKILKRILFEIRKSKRENWERIGELDNITNNLTMQECKNTLVDISERVKNQGYAEDVNFDESGRILTYFIDEVKYKYLIIPAYREDAKYAVIRAKLIYRP